MSQLNLPHGADNSRIDCYRVLEADDDDDDDDPTKT